MKKTEKQENTTPQTEETKADTAEEEKDYIDVDEAQNEAEENETDKASEPTIEEKLTAELEAEKDRYLRLMAEYDNFRKRTAKEKEGIYANAKADAFEMLIPVLDNFDRAFQNSDASADDFKKGIEMTHNQLLEIFSKAGVESFAETGDTFDPNIHNAVMHVDDETLGENVVADVFQKGYKLGDKVLRHAMVKVAN